MFKQPRVPETQNNLLRPLVLFLKDFCLDAWQANKRRKDEIDVLKKRLDKIEKGG